MIAHALAIPGAKTLTKDELAASAHAGMERAEYTGEGADWEAAKAAAGVPSDALVLWWRQG